jgi:hypothetical protein
MEKNTLIVRFYGFHGVTLPQGYTVHIVVMSNVFHTGIKLDHVYDLKVSPSSLFPSFFIYLFYFILLKLRVLGSTVNRENRIWGSTWISLEKSNFLKTSKCFSWGKYQEMPQYERTKQ